MLFGQFAVIMRVDDDETRFVIIEMPFDQRQGAFADRAEADHDDGAGNFGVDLRGRVHEWSPESRAGCGVMVFSSKVDTGSREQNASNKREESGGTSLGSHFN